MNGDGGVQSAYPLAVDPNVSAIQPIGAAAADGATGQAADAGHVHTIIHGKAALASGTATVALPAITATSLVLLSAQPGAVPLALPYVSSVTPGTGFVITSLNALDTGTIGWAVIL